MKKQNLDEQSNVLENLINLKASLMPPDFSESGNSHIFIFENTELLKFNQYLGWIQWNGIIWKSIKSPIKQAKSLSEDMLKQAECLNEILRIAICRAEASKDNEQISTLKLRQTEAKNYLSHSKKTRSAKYIRSMISLSECDLTVHHDTFDADPHLLNTPDGIVNLCTGETQPHDSNRFCSKITAVGPDNKNEHIWLDFVSNVTGGDDQVSEYLQTIVGMCLFGKVYTESIVIVIGPTGTGKSTFFNTVQEVMGDYSWSIDPDVLTTNMQRNTYALAQLKGKRLVVAAELENGATLSSKTLKLIASTNEISAEKKYKDPISFHPSHTLILFTNFLPKIHASDDATRRRISLIPFNEKISSSLEIKNFREVLFNDCCGAILAWAIEGAKKFYRNGYKLNTPKSIEETTTQYFKDYDCLSNFIVECCIVDENASVGAKELRDAYVCYASQNNFSPGNTSDFNTELGLHSFKFKNTNKGKIWLGIGLLSN